MLSVLGFLVVLGPLVIVHELGHFLFARLFGVKAEVFSVGFGPTIASKLRGETEWRLSAIPLGGYVKLLGDDGETETPPELKDRTLQSKEPWKRFFIFFGGPLFNFLFAIVVFMAILAIGEPQVSSVVGRVVDGSVAAQAGFRQGDQILSVDGKPVKRFEDVALMINANPNETLSFEVLRKGGATPQKIQAPIGTQEGYTIYGEHKAIGHIEGLFPAPLAAELGISNPASAAAKAGIQTGDQVTTLNGQEIGSWESLQESYAAVPPGMPLQLTLKRADETLNVTLKKPAQSGGLGNDLGIHSSELFVEKVMEKSPAEAAGLKAGDRLVEVGGKKVNSFFELKDSIHALGVAGKPVPLTYERAGRISRMEIKPDATEMKDVALKKSTQFTVGVVPMLKWGQPTTHIERVWNPFMLLYRGTERMLDFSWRNIVSIKKMVTGDVSVGTLGGPILIGKLAGESISRGLIAFLTTMALLSIGLGILNVLPIPVLDGGHLLLLGIEAVRRKPLTIRQTEVIQQVGLSLILLLMVVVIRNDLSRLPFFN